MRYKDVYLPATFVLSSFTFGLKTSSDNFAFGQDVSSCFLDFSAHAWWNGKPRIRSCSC